MMLVIVLLLASQVALSCASVVISLNGDDWMLSGPNITSVSARVPGGIYTDLLRNNKIDDPYYRMNDVSLRWVALGNWTYTKTFQISSDYLKHGRIDLVFSGLDTVAQVFLNEVEVAKTKNMFRRYVIEVTKGLKTGSNTLRVEFQSAIAFAEREAKRYPYPVPPGCPPPVQHGECHFNFIRKEACSFSWDWGPSFPSVGIWKNVTLEAYEASVVRYITTETKFEGGFWTLQIFVYFDVEASSANGTIRVSIPELGVSTEKQVELSAKKTMIAVAIPLSGDVELWWPNGQGRQRLYKASVDFRDSTGKDSEHRTVLIGFRTVELVQDKVGGDEPGYSFYFRVNGVPVFIKGSNWIPADSFQERITTSYLEKLLTSAAEANMNMLRVWGGGVYESEEFYELADRLGIMIWQDFMYACALYPVHEEFLADVKEEVTHQIRRLKRHPSIVIWSGNNENEGAISNNWFNIPADEINRYKDDYRKLYINTIAQAVLEEDMTRPFVPSSPSNGLDTVQEGWIAANPQSTQYGDIHYYTYDRDTWDWRTFPMPRFASEFGIQSWCSMETLASVSVPVDWDLDSDFVQHRQHHDQGNEQIESEIRLQMPLPNAANRTQRFIDFIYLSQINQAVGIKTEVEFYRRSQNELSDGSGLTMGALYWQLNDIWQGPTWASIEYGGKWKMLQYFARSFFSRTLISPYEEDGLVKLYYINDDAWKNDSTNNNNNNKTVTSSLPLSLSADHPLDGLSSTRGRQGVVEMERKLGVRLVDKTTVLIRCFHWSKLEERKTWTITFEKPSLAAQCIYISRLSDLMEQCECSHPSRCFLHFSGFHSGVVPAFPENHLFLTKLSEVVGLERAKIRVNQIYAFNSTFASIVISTSAIAPFVWLEAVGYSGRFSDNGFLMVASEKLITYSAWSPVPDWVRFQDHLSVRSWLDAYAEN